MILRDIQCLLIKPGDSNTIKSLKDCLLSIKWQMDFLQPMNRSLRLFYLRPLNVINQIEINVGILCNKIKPTAKNLGVGYDSHPYFKQKNGCSVLLLSAKNISNIMCYLYSTEHKKNSTCRYLLHLLQNVVSRLLSRRIYHS